MASIKLQTGAAPAAPGAGYVTIYAQADADIAWVDSDSTEHVVSQVGHTHTGSEVTDFVEVAQDAVGAMLVDGTTIDLTYTDATPSLTAEVKAASLANSYLANMAEATVKGRASGAGTGAPTDLTAAQVVAIVATADGASSGLDADLLDGQHGSYYAAATAVTEAAQDAIGAMLVDGTTIDFTYTDATPSLTAEVKAASLANSYLANMAQATVKGRASGAGTGAPTDLTAAQVVAIVATADGASSGLDADLLDGQQGTYYSASTHTHTGYVATTDYEDADVLTKIKNVDGASSGLDADLLDGQHGSYYAAATAVTDSGWVEITSFESGWSATNNAGETPARVRKVGNLVMCKGGVESTATHTSGTGKSAFTLPDGYRPSDRRVFAGYNDLSISLSIRVDSDGSVYITNTSASTIGANTTTYHLDSIAFLI